MREEAGFTLIETLVAMMVLVISLVTIMQLFSGGLRSSWVSKDYTRAVFHAREQMEAVLMSRRMADETFGGEFEDGYRWQVTTAHINPRDPDADPPKPADPLDLFRVTVTVTWEAGQRERSYEIETIHIAEKVETETTG